MVNKLILFGLFCTLLQATCAKGADPDFDDTPLNIYVDSGKEIDSFINLTKTIDSKQQIMEAALERLSAEVKAMAERMSAEVKALEQRCNQQMCEVSNRQTQGLSVKVTRLNQKVNELSEQLAKSQDVATPQKRPAERACEQIKNDMRSTGVTNITGTPYYSFQLITYSHGQRISKMCMGALIDKRFILTLADCLPKLFNMQLRLPYSAKSEGIKIYLQTKFSENTTRSDIALIELDSDVYYNHNLYPVCLYTSQLEPKKLIHRSVETQLVANAKCERYNPQRLEACAKDLLPDACTVAGEPIFAMGQNVHELELFGLILMETCVPKSYLIAKVFDQLDFIESIAWPQYGK